MAIRKKDTIICLVISLVGLLAALVVLYMRLTVPYWQCSEVYKRYAHVEGVRATYIKNFPVNDTLTVGVTLLEATTDSGWVRLQEDFGLPVIPKEKEATFCGDSNRVSLKKYPKSVPLLIDGDTLAKDVIAISRYKHKIAYFEIQNRVHIELISHKHYEDNVSNDNLKKSNHEENN